MAVSNNLLTNDIILKTALMEFDNNLIFAKTARRDYDTKFDPTTGGSIRVRKPTRYTARTGDNVAIQAINQQYTSVEVGDMVGVDVEVTSRELALELDDFNREILNPAMVTLANKIDSLLYETTSQIYNYVGTAGVRPASFSVVNDASAVLNSFGIPQDSDRFLMMKSFDASSLQSALYNSFNESFNKEILLRGSMGELAGFDCYSVQNIIRPAVGTAVTSIGSPQVNGASQSGTTLILDGLSANATVSAGRVFTIASVNSVNAASREDTGRLAQFVVASDAQADGSGNITLTLGADCPLTISGPYQTITALPQNNAAITFVDLHTINLAYHREAFALTTIKLPATMDEGAWQKSMVNDKAKISIRMSKQYTIMNDKHIIRFDVLPAVKCFPQYACRVLGS